MDQTLHNHIFYLIKILRKEHIVVQEDPKDLIGQLSLNNEQCSVCKKWVDKKYMVICATSYYIPYICEQCWDKLWDIWLPNKVYYSL